MTITDGTSTVQGVKSKRHIALEAIRREGGCNRRLAISTLGFLQSIVDWSRENEYETFHPNDEDLASPEYKVFSQFMRHGQSATPGSAHAAVEDFLLDPSKDELSLIHDMSGETLEDCAVMMTLSRPSMD